MPLHITVVALACVLAAGACDSGGPTPSPSPTPTLRPTPAGSAVGDEQVIDAFSGALATLASGFHVQVAIDYTGSQFGFVGFDVDARGADYQGEFHAEIPGETLDLEVIIVEGVAYARRRGETWRAVPEYRDLQPVNPFHRLDPGTLQHLGTVELPSGTLHDLVTMTWVGEEPDETIIQDATIADPEFHVYVRDDGTPVEAQLTFTVSGTVEGGPVQLDYLVSYAFSDLGNDVLIAAPPVQ